MPYSLRHFDVLPRVPRGKERYFGGVYPLDIIPGNNGSTCQKALHDLMSCVQQTNRSGDYLASLGCFGTDDTTLTRKLFKLTH
jgi:hypothetical protein